ncbi:hypothetical protein QTO34_002017 [Cnephaeus nilssonii]|uniref:Lipid-binding serum glycoprotein C-terminal domain-containing protein n=1 Tax=Cnephaeus nilssonii TaxID=3371016 RepID=A0AA40HTY3_CNENI|nr:hypothetical protein QTO34_002017 [Eptesicus nilssonii]
MLQILCLVLCGLLTRTRAEPGALLRLGMDILNHEVQSAMNESHILEKMAAEAGKKRPGVKPIKGITERQVGHLLMTGIILPKSPRHTVSQCVSTGMTITAKGEHGREERRCPRLSLTCPFIEQRGDKDSLPLFKSEGCEVILVSVKTNLPSKMMPNVVNKFLDSTLHKVLPGMMCPAIDAVLVYVNKKWANLNAPMPIGQMGTVKYILTSIPSTTASYIQVDFSPVVQQQEGNTIQLADDGEAPEFPEDYDEGSSQLLLSAAFLTAELALLQKSFDVNIQDTMVGELPPQTTKTLSGFIPEVAQAYPKPKPLVTQIRINKPPKVTMETGKSLLHLHGTLEMFAARRRRGKAPVSLFLLEAHFNLNIQYSVRENRLHMTTSLNRLLSLSRETSSVGAFQVTEVKGISLHNQAEMTLTVFLRCAPVGLPLPDFLDMNYNLAELDIVENALVMDLNLD